MLFWDGGKAPTEVADFSIDWTSRLGTDTIATSSWAITGGDAPATGTLAFSGGSSGTHTTTSTTIILAAGNLGVLYTLANTVTTAAGQTLVDSVQLLVTTPPAASNLTSLANALQWLGVANDTDGKIARVIGALSTQIQKFLGFNVLQTSYTRTFDGQGTIRFFVPDLPLVSVQSLTIDGVAIPQGSWSGGAQQAGYYNNANSIALIGYYFTRGFQNVTMTYTAGYQTVPADIEQACLDWMKIVYLSGQMTTIGSNVVKVSAGDTSLDFGGSGTVTDTKKISMPTAIYAVLKNYRRVAQVSGF